MEQLILLDASYLPQMAELYKISFAGEPWNDDWSDPYQLMDEIWGEDSETGWETVTVHIGRLRKRFDQWEEFAIESVRGLGYRAVKKV